MRKGGTSALLQKVNAQLRGERVSNTQQAQEKDEVEAYLSGLNFKAGKQLEWDKFGEVSDISISDDDPPKAQEVTTANKFLKKKTSVPQEKENVPVPSRSGVQPSKAASKAGVSAALDKVKAFSNKYSTKTVQKKPSFSNVLSDSDMDMDISLDEDVLASVSRGQPKSLAANYSKNTEGRSQQVPTSSSQFKTLKNQKSDDSNFSLSRSSVGNYNKVLQKQTALDSDEDSVGVGRGGNKFMKKKPAPVEIKAEEKEKPLTQKPVEKFQLQSAQKYSTQVRLDSDEESLADFIQGLSTSSGVTVSPPKTPREQTTRKPKIKSTRSKDTESEIQSQISTDDSLHSGFVPNVMNLQDLQPVSDSSDIARSNKKLPKKVEKKKKDDVESSVFKSFGLQTLDDLDMEEDIEVPDEIPFRSPSPLKSILSTTPRPVTPKSNRSRVRYSVDELSEIRSKSPSPEPISTARQVESVVYTDEFESGSDAAKDPASTGTESSYTSQGTDSVETVASKSKSYSKGKDEEYSQYSDDFDEDSRSRTQSQSSYSDDEDTIYRSDSYTSMTSEESYTSATRSVPKRKVRTKTMDTQTLPEPGLWYHWNLERGGAAILSPQYGLANVDPTPIATHVVNADALEAMTSYSPSVLAMNDMLRQQLEMTRHFIENQRRFHQVHVGSLSPDCAYTTLEDTKQYLNKNRKPRLTFDEALKQVKEEMGLS